MYSRNPNFGRWLLAERTTISDAYNCRGAIVNWNNPDPMDPNAEFRRGDFFDLKKLNGYHRATMDAIIRCYQYWVAELRTVISLIRSLQLICGLRRSPGCEKVKIQLGAPSNSFPSNSPPMAVPMSIYRCHRREWSSWVNQVITSPVLCHYPACKCKLRNSRGETPVQRLNAFEKLAGSV